MDESGSTLATVWLILLRLVEVHGIDPEQFRKTLGVAPETLRDVQARLPGRLADIALSLAAAEIGDEAFALRAAECWHPSNLGTMGYAWLSSRTLHTGLKRMERFSRILGSRIRCRCSQECDGVRLGFDHGRGDAAVGPLLTDFSLSILIAMCRVNAGHSLSPVSVQLRRPEPANPEPWHAFFGCPIAFGEPADAFLLAGEVANAPLPSANIPLANTFDTFLSEQLAGLFADDIVSRCKTTILQHLTSGMPSAPAVAHSLGLSQRSLQRRLAALGLTFQSVVDETRHELARRYLDDPGKSITEITFLLGFSEQSAFTRAFRRWSGMAPSSYRGIAVTA
ncbi:AraC family transcriptional regulator [Accumulibacter sp.]|uniref:AraC family transcriptional regulator n=1 Tax=Accumulibacter sp. TaxID=2053492 RepID=UPI0035B01BC5